MQANAPYEEDWELARQRAEAANVSVGEWLSGVATYDEKRKRDLAEFRDSCHQSLKRVKDGEGIPFNPDTFLEDTKRWAQERDEANIPISDDQKPADSLVEFSPEARNDLADIRRYTLDKFGENQVDVYLSKLAEGIQRIQLMPGIGRRHNEIPDDLLLVKIEQHYLVYQHFEDRIYVVRILFHPKQLGPIFRRVEESVLSANIYSYHNLGRSTISQSLSGRRFASLAEGEAPPIAAIRN